MIRRAQFAHDATKPHAAVRRFTWNSATFQPGDPVPPSVLMSDERLAARLFRFGRIRYAAEDRQRPPTPPEEEGAGAALSSSPPAAGAAEGDAGEPEAPAKAEEKRAPAQPERIVIDRVAETPGRNGNQQKRGGFRK